MAEKRTICMDEYGISKNAYRELYYFCLQYEEKREQLKHLYGGKSPIISGMPKGSGRSDSTFNTAEKALRLRKDIEDIEQAAIEADGEIYGYILDNVARGIPYERMNVPCGRRQFYDRRKAFFYILHRKKG